ncbi:MAG: hypothetical protein IT302_07045 [Dehalococcoidia bacterium]|nr:hypothetical protein [Dehalococcoidia bacterium]
MTEEPRDDAKVSLPGRQDAELVSMPRCTRCKLKYLPARSTSALRLTYCSFLCELGDLGFSMTGLETMERARKDDSEAATEPPAAEPAGAR